MASRSLCGVISYKYIAVGQLVKLMAKPDRIRPAINGSYHISTLINAASSVDSKEIPAAQWREGASDAETGETGRAGRNGKQCLHTLRSTGDGPYLSELQIVRQEEGLLLDTELAAPEHVVGGVVVPGRVVTAAFHPADSADDLGLFGAMLAKPPDEPGAQGDGEDDANEVDRGSLRFTGRWRGIWRGHSRHLWRLARGWW